MKNIFYLFLFLSFQVIGLNASTTEFYFVRHAETEVNRDIVYIGGESPWAELTNKGKDQARLLGNHLKQVKFDAYYTSDVIRTQQTARYFFESQGNIHQKIMRDRRLTEQSQGDWEGRLREEVYTPEIKSKLGWTFVPGDLIKGESQQDVAKRMVSWIIEKTKKHPDQRVFVLSHGLAIRYLVAELFNYDRETAYKIPVDNTSVTIIRCEDDSFSCPVMNDTSHLK